MSRPDDRWNDPRIAWGCALVVAFGGLVALLGWLASACLDRETAAAITGSGLLVSLPMAVAGTCLLLGLGIALLVFRPWEREPDEE